MSNFKEDYGGIIVNIIGIIFAIGFGIWVLDCVITFFKY